MSVLVHDMVPKKGRLLRQYPCNNLLAYYQNHVHMYNILHTYITANLGWRIHEHTMALDSLQAKYAQIMHIM